MFLIAYMGTALIIAVIVIGLSAYLAKRSGKSPVRWGSLSALALFVLVFWDYYPTKWVHQYHCEKEAGFWVFKTLEQWKKENPGVMEGLVANKGAPSKRSGDMTNYADTYFLNARFNWVVRHNGPFIPNLWRHEQEVVDTARGEVLARYIDFSTSQEQPQAGWSGWKFWLDSGHCGGGERNDSRMWQFTKNFLVTNEPQPTLRADAA